jgi:hypothetical protein
MVTHRPCVILAPCYTRFPVLHLQEATCHIPWPSSVADSHIVRERMKHLTLPKHTLSYTDILALREIFDIARSLNLCCIRTFMVVEGRGVLLRAKVLHVWRAHPGGSVAYCSQPPYVDFSKSLASSASLSQTMKELRKHLRMRLRTYIDVVKYATLPKNIDGRESAFLGIWSSFKSLIGSKCHFHMPTGVNRGPFVWKTNEQ